MRRGLAAIAVAAAGTAAFAEGDAPATVVAAKEEVAFHVDLTGAFDAPSSAEVAYRPKVFGDEAEVVEARAAGPVAAGDVLVRFRSEKIEAAIRAGEHDLAVARAALAVQAESLERQHEITAAAVARAEFDAATAAQALGRFVEIERPLRLEEADLELDGTRSRLTDQTEELAQLEKMYKADDLTEETEDIVLKRARRDLERTKKWLEIQTRRDKSMREIDLPREERNLTLEAQRTAADRDRALAVSKLEEAQARLEFERAKANVAKDEAELARLVSDLACFELKAPVAGFACPGTLVRGRWHDTEEMSATLKKRGKVGAGTVVFTVVTGGWRGVGSVPEASLAWIRAGQDALIVPTLADSRGYAAKVLPVRPATSADAYTVEFEPTEATEGLVGMTCRIRIVTGTRRAILVPETAVEDAGFDKWVHVFGADGKSSRRLVTLGQTLEKRVEVTSGLAEGDLVLETAPAK